MYVFHMIVMPTLFSSFPLYRIVTVLCDHPYLVSLLFAILLSLYVVTIVNVF